ncbi:MAG: FKBP-type peptidyl-prolyl cis-trans isomerase [Gammaproteobacteria bacterium]|nr:FKBP-type peptidyl-prolyl cis-trans isomerase [Gammaproteobacteria bacterium]
MTATTPQIGKHKKVSLQYSLTTGGGVVVRAATEKAIQYVHGCGALFPKLEAALEGHATGEIVRARLLPDDAFGRRNTELLHEVPLSAVPPGEQITVGGTLVGEDEQGQAVTFRIAAIAGDTLTLDANHPLAGETLVFEIEIQDIRDATAQEIAQAAGDTLQRPDNRPDN